MSLPMLPADKANHFVYGAVLACFGMYWDPFVALGLAVLAGVGKEIYDRISKRGTPDFMDSLAAIAGGAVVVLPALLTMYKLPLW